jgi:ubiquinone/menaquinone biosynthesis C-methylase UbiE
MWREIWEKKGEKKPSNLTLKELMALDGFDMKTGEMTQETWMEIVDYIRDKLSLSKGQRLLEIGCGSGALSLPLSHYVSGIVGLDYSKSLVKIANTIAAPDDMVLVSEAKSLPLVNGFFNCVISHGVFFYFPDFSYAEKVLDEALRVTKKEAKILIMDIPEIAKKTQSEDFRAKMIGAEDYKRLYSNLPHLYFEKRWFINYAERNHLHIEVSDQAIKGYKNSPFRFNVLLQKNYNVSRNFC